MISKIDLRTKRDLLNDISQVYYLLNGQTSGGQNATYGSLFKTYLIEGLKGNEETVDNYGYVTPDSLGRYVYNKIMSLPPEERPIQKPIRKVQQSGDIILAYYPQFARTMIDNHFAGANVMTYTRESERYHRPGKSAMDMHSEGRRIESVIIDAALPVNVTYEDAIFIALVNRPSLTILKTTLSFRPYYVFDYKLHSIRPASITILHLSHVIRL